MSIQTDIEHATYYNTEHMQKLRKSLADYDSDPKKVGRLEVCECKMCYYMNTSRIGGSAMTLKKCNNCDKETMYSSTVTNKYCLDCAKSLVACAYCSQKMD